jgi:hypothetical protein
VRTNFLQHFFSNGVELPESMFAPISQPSPEQLY